MPQDVLLRLAYPGRPIPILNCTAHQYPGTPLDRAEWYCNPLPWDGRGSQENSATIINKETAVVWKDRRTAENHSCGIYRPYRRRSLSSSLLVRNRFQTRFALVPRGSCRRTGAPTTQFWSGSTYGDAVLGLGEENRLIPTPLGYI